MRAILPLIFAVCVVVTTAGCGSSKKQADGSMIGVMTAGALPEVTIDGKPMRLAPGARIYNSGNLTITPSQVPANSRIRYKTDATGLVSQVWLLPPEH